MPAGRRSICHLPSPSVFSVPSVVGFFRFDLFDDFVVRLIDGRGLGLIIVHAFACGLGQTVLPGTLPPVVGRAVRGR